MAEAEELRIAVAMNGGVSLAVWIGGVAYELARLDQMKGGWAEQRRVKELRPRVDVMVGTSAGGMNAAFLATALIYGTPLDGLRILWFDRGGLEAAPGSDPERQLLRDPKLKKPSSLLDGNYLLDGITAAFEALVPADGIPAPNGHPVDVRLTATGLNGWAVDIRDDYGGVFPNREHDAIFHFRHSLPPGPEHFPGTGLDRDLLIRRLSRAARATASYPFAFPPSIDPADPDGDHGTILFPASGANLHTLDPHEPLLDGGVMNNLPVDQAIEAIFEMPAEDRVKRVIAAVVPDPSVSGRPAPAPGPPSAFSVVTASLTGIPRNRSIARFLVDVRQRSENSAIRRQSRPDLLAEPLDAIVSAADVVWAGYRRQRNARIAGRLHLELEEAGINELSLRSRGEIELLLPTNVPWMPVNWKDDDGAWDAATVRRIGALLLDMLTWPEALPAATRRDLRTEIHAVLADARQCMPADDVAKMARSVVNELDAGYTSAEAVATAIDDWPYVSPARKQELPTLIDRFATTLLRLSGEWADDRPAALTGLLEPQTVTARRRRARRLLCAAEILQYTGSALDDDPEQVVCLGILTPRRPVCLDPRLRDTSDQKLAGDEFAHFAAFLRRSWRANDWMWGRLDAVAFLGAVLELSDDDVRPLQAEVVREEAPVICQAVRVDLKAGAKCRLSAGLAQDLPVAPLESWADVVRRLHLDTTPEGNFQREAEFLRMNIIGEERIADEKWQPLLTRLSTRAIAVAVAVLRDAGIPVAQSLIRRLLAPVQGVARASYRYVRGLRPDPPSLRSTVVTAATVAVVAVVAFADLLGVEFGVLAPVAWIALLGAFVALFLLAPLTSTIGALLIFSAGFLASLPAEQPQALKSVPGGWGHWWLPLNRAVAIAVVVVTLCLMSSRWVDRVDDFLRGMLGRRKDTIDAMESGLGAEP